MNKFITTPIYYVNDSPHLGHAYTTIACDVMTRYLRQQNHNVKFLTGTDEHGQKIDKAAKLANIDTQKFTDLVSQRFKALVKAKIDGVESENLLNISNDDFIRTTEERHKIACKKLWEKLEENGFIYLDKYAGWYSVRDEAYYQESELINGKAPTGAEVEWLEEESYFFALSKFGDKLLEFYQANPDFIYPKTRFNEVVSFVKTGLKDLSISRTNFSWGVPVPSNPKHIMYVWIDALTNYLTALGYPNETAPEFKQYWLDGDVFHIVGKDILRFHAVYWPAFLMAANLPLPKRIIAHGWWTIEGEKMSKSLGNVIAPRDLIENYGLDQTRYFLLKAMPFGNDGDLSKEKLVETCNADLANNIGNLTQRTLSLIVKNCESKIPEIREFDKIIEDNFFEKIDAEMKDFQFSNALAIIMEASSKANEYIDKQAPWSLKKEGKIDEMQKVLYSILEAIRIIAIALKPFCPASCENILKQLSVNSENKLQAGIIISAPTPVFKKLELKNLNEDVKEF
ncbi:MAG: methionine--tRNA ligase [Rickettsiales bacterium]|nr:methionine--tRNA ligase [Rickettsiales bacterium]